MRFLETGLCFLLLSASVSALSGRADETAAVTPVAASQELPLTKKNFANELLLRLAGEAIRLNTAWRSGSASQICTAAYDFHNRAHMAKPLARTFGLNRTVVLGLGNFVEDLEKILYECDKSPIDMEKLRSFRKNFNDELNELFEN